MSTRILTLASGSEGNVLLACLDNRRMLIDVGISGKSLAQQLEKLGLTFSDIHGVLLTHEHIDHCRGLALLLNKNPLPVYTSRGTFEGLARHSFFAKLPKECFHLFRAGESFEWGPVRVKTIPISHDALEPVAFRLDTGRYAFATVTDLGCFDQSLIQSLTGINGLLLEANHNRQMLETGPYPYRLKLRIDGAAGHLSNEAAAALLKKLAHPGLKHVILGHLSKTNNYAPLALETVSEAVRSLSEESRPQLYVAPPLGPSAVITGME